MLARQKLWMPASQHAPELFLKYSHQFLFKDRTTRHCMRAIDVLPEMMHVVAVPDPRGGSGRTGGQATVSEMMAIHLTILHDCCESLEGSPATSAKRVMADDYLLTLLDSFTSFHIVEKLVAVHLPHVSMNITTQFLDHAALP